MPGSEQAVHKCLLIDGLLVTGLHMGCAGTLANAF